MSYFNRFTLVNYNGQLQVNLTKRVTIDDSMKTNPAYYVEYSIQEGETPELLADKFYDDADLAWVILLYNNMVNIFEEWPKSQNELDNYIREKYADIHDIHHFKSIADGYVVSEEIHPLYDSIPVTNVEYEYNINDEKRNIKLLLPDYIGEVVRQQKELMRK